MRGFLSGLLGLAVLCTVLVLSVLAFREGTAAAGTTPERLCGPEVRLSDIPGNLDVTINGVHYPRPSGVERWSTTFNDDDGKFTAIFHNESGNWGQTDYDVGPSLVCAGTTTVPNTTTTTVGPPPPVTTVPPLPPIDRTPRGPRPPATIPQTG